MLAPPALLGVIAVQGAHVRRTALRLPDALGETGEHGTSSGQPFHLVVVGDSVASGVGVGHHDDTIAGRLAELIGRTRAVRRTVIARSGYTAAEAVRLVDGEFHDADLVVVSIGVNDTKNLHSARRWRRDLTALLDSVTAQAPNAPVVLLGLPPMEVFPAMPRPLGLALGIRVRLMDRVGRQVAARYPAVVRLELPRSAFAGTSGAFADDGFHPSAASHSQFAARIHDLIHDLIHDPLEESHV